MKTGEENCITSRQQQYDLLVIEHRFDTIPKLFMMPNVDKEVSTGINLCQYSRSNNNTC
jgi:hypothetical protein